VKLLIPTVNVPDPAGSVTGVVNPSVYEAVEPAVSFDRVTVGVPVDAPILYGALIMLAVDANALPDDAMTAPAALPTVSAAIPAKLNNRRDSEVDRLGNRPSPLS
jgi:hypothetical protein